LESKAGIPLDAVVTHGEMMRAFEAFKDANDEHQALTDKRSGDVVLEEKLARLNSTLDAQARRLDEITLKGARPAIGGERAAVRSASALEHKAAFDAYVRSGETTNLRALELKALSPAPIRTAAIWCRPKWRRRSASASPRFRRSARSPACA
jgi:HK97 family phage major capsid protein